METLGRVNLHTGKNHLRVNQVLVLGGCFSGTAQDQGWIIRGDESLPEPTPQYTSNAQEADMRIWRHAT